MNKCVLIIDDDSVLRGSLTRGLRSEGFDVVTAESAEFAKDVLARLIPDAIVLDRMMTGQDGLDFLKTLRSGGNHVPVIMLTALAGPENAIEGLVSGADDYLAKPFQLRELVLRLNNIIKKSVGADLKLPDGLVIKGDDFFVQGRLLNISGEEKKLLYALVTPVGNIVVTTPMIAKRLRNKLNGVLSNINIVTVRGQGYKIVNTNGD